MHSPNLNLQTHDRSPRDIPFLNLDSSISTRDNQYLRPHFEFPHLSNGDDNHLTVNPPENIINFSPSPKYFRSTSFPFDQSEKFKYHNKEELKEILKVARDGSKYILESPTTDKSFSDHSIKSLNENRKDELLSNPLELHSPTSASDSFFFKNSNIDLNLNTAFDMDPDPFREESLIGNEDEMDDDELISPQASQIGISSSSSPSTSTSKSGSTITEFQDTSKGSRKRTVRFSLSPNMKRRKLKLENTSPRSLQRTKGSTRSKKFNSKSIGEEEKFKTFIALKPKSLQKFKKKVSTTSKTINSRLTGEKFETFIDYLNQDMITKKEFLPKMRKNIAAHINRTSILNLSRILFPAESMGKLSSSDWKGIFLTPPKSHTTITISVSINQVNEKKRMEINARVPSVTLNINGLPQPNVGSGDVSKCEIKFNGVQVYIVIQGFSSFF